MSEFRISNEQSKLLAVGLYKSAVDYIASVRGKSSDDFYESFKADYLAKQVLQASAPVKRRQSRNRNIKSR